MWRDAISDTTSIYGSAAVSGDRLLDLLIEFLDCLPEVVRGEASLVIAALSGDEFIDLDEEFDFEYAARGVFEAPTRLGRLGRLINVVAVLDVYFAGDPRLRLGTLLARYDRLCVLQKNVRLEAARTDVRLRCVNQVADALEASQSRKEMPCPQSRMWKPPSMSPC